VARLVSFDKLGKCLNYFIFENGEVDSDEFMKGVETACKEPVTYSLNAKVQ